ncbi:YczE/YyaS/YitT family protein [Clostridium beijerinckii]|uniref:YitT family protein n=1 Tax=Clostridium beijerinckii TaxID=1520 RepID=A0A9Q5CUV2_CLOBE|nr:DUF6198 family protein [Clostridium beijerinckii]MBA2884512.1 hypothetical protein [Clostridium beijerinckii]MBA2898118.1 hypothetical protein [Clostridium beijerinckii]MBA2909969.1 hypothetical protein [Clostridium beijerinckii]MBA9012941.1 hypothetical protein [Clostridium beijerinckii]MBC2416301.1 YitT family protein [Clostridium beijerinckii]
MSKKELIRRYILFIVGLFIMAMGISLMVKAQLGTSPISSMPYVISLKFTSISLGMFTIMWNMILIISQIFILGKKFQAFQLLQIPLSFIFGSFVDFTRYMLSGISIHRYISCILLLFLGCFVLALGVSFTVLADVIMNSGEAFVQAISIKTGKDFSFIKVTFDISLVILSIIASLVFFHKIVGMREGTIIAAIISGFIIKFYNKNLSFIIDEFIADKNYETVN